MAKIGLKIQETRLRKGITLDRIADDTNISVKFLSKIENDDFSGFPGEPYVVGFIRNYAEYLGLDPEATIALYRNPHEEVPAQPEKRPIAAPKAAAAAAAAVVAAAPEEAPGVQPADAATDAAAPVLAVAPATAPVPAASPASAAAAGEAESAAQKPKKSRKAKPKTEENPEKNAAPLAPAPSPAPALFPADAKKQTAATSEADEQSLAAEKTDSGRKKPAPPALRTIIVGFLAIGIVGIAVLWIVAGGRSPYQKPLTGDKTPTEYRVEGGPFEKRLYVGDSLLVPLGNDVYKIRLASIGEAVDLETPFGPLKLALGETGPLDPDKNGSADASLIVGDFEKNKPASGALLRVEFSPPATDAATAGEVTIPGTAAAPQTQATPAETVIIKSTRGPYPFIVQVTFRGNCLFRYEIDRKEWVEKYYSKGESLTMNVTNALNVWASNAQAVKLIFQASGGKTADLEIGAPGEIAVKRIAWSRAEGSWALISSDLD